jgi:hypothetical protein
MGTSAGAAGWTGLATRTCTAAFRLIPLRQRPAPSPTARRNRWADVDAVVIGGLLELPADRRTGSQEVVARLLQGSRSEPTAAL